MSKIKWDETGKKFYEYGVDHGVLYPAGEDGEYASGVAWNGLTAVNDTPSGGEPSPVYADNIKYANIPGVEECNGTIEAYTYPDEFAACDGSAEPVPGVTIGQQSRKPFCFSWRSKIGNDVNDSLGYKIHVVYNALAKPAEKPYSTVTETTEPNSMSWEFTTTPVEVEGYKPTAKITINSTKVSPAGMEAIEAILYGDGNNEPRIPMPEELIEIMLANVA